MVLGDFNMGLSRLFQELKGGPGSGNFGHSGRPGKRGGSALNYPTMSWQDHRAFSGAWSRDISDILQWVPPGTDTEDLEPGDEAFDEASQTIHGIRGALDSYKYFSANLNSDLRKGKTLTGREKEIDKYLELGLSARKAKAPRNMKVYRGMSSEHVSDKFSHKAYTSTSVNEGNARSFGNPIEILIPKGFPIIPADIGEGEVILPKNVTFTKVGENQYKVSK